MAIPLSFMGMHLLYSPPAACNYHKEEQVKFSSFCRPGLKGMCMCAWVGLRIRKIRVFITLRYLLYIRTLKPEYHSNYLTIFQMSHPLSQSMEETCVRRSHILTYANSPNSMQEDSWSPLSCAYSEQVPCEEANSSGTN